MTVVKGKVVDIGDYFNFKVGNRTKSDYCPFIIKCKDGDSIKISVDVKTMINKTYMVNSDTGRLIQVGMIKPNIGDWLEVEGLLYPIYNGITTKKMINVRKITKIVEP